MQGSWIGEAKTEGLFRFAQSYAVGADIIRPRSLHKYLDPHVNGSSGSPTPTTDPAQNHTAAAPMQGSTL